MEDSDKVSVSHPIMVHWWFFSERGCTYMKPRPKVAVSAIFLVVVI